VGRRFLPLVLAAASLGLFAAAAGASPLIITGPFLAPDNPFPAGCGGPGESGGAFLYPDSEVEPWLEVNPADPNDMVAFTQQDRWSDGGAHGLAIVRTDNGGVSWTTPAPPKFSRCAGGTAANGGNYERSSDPWISFAADGTLHAISISFDRSTARNAVLVSKSTDQGNSWTDPTTLRFDTSRSGPLANLFNDKESITADPDNAHVYAVWDRITSPADNPRNPPPAYENSLAFHGPTWFARSTDAGDSWETARPIFAPKASRTQTIGNQIVVLPSGTLVNGFNYRFFSKAGVVRGGDHVTVIRSTDKGETWSDAINVASMGDRGVFDPEPVAQCRPDMSATTLCTLVRTGDIIPDFAVDRSGTATNGNLYAVWQSHVSATANGRAADDTIYLSRSTDGGRHWSATPVKVNDTTPGKQAFTAAVHVAADGTVGVTYYDFRNDMMGDSELTTDYWIAHSHDGGQSFGPSQRLTQTGSFDMRDAPYARGYFVGDYEGLSNAGTAFKSFFDVGTPGVPSGSVNDRSDNMWASAG
jgi:BNR repeat-like domain